MRGASIDFVLVIPRSGAGEKTVASADADERGVAEADVSSGIRMPSIRRDDVLDATRYRAVLDPLNQSRNDPKLCRASAEASFSVGP